MARVEISFFSTGNRSAEGGTMPVPRATGLRTEVLASGGTSIQTGSTSLEAAQSGFVRILAEADVWVTAGANPTAAVPASGSSGSGLRALAGVPLDLAVAAGDKVAIIDVVAL